MTNARNPGLRVALVAEDPSHGEQARKQLTAGGLRVVTVTALAKLSGPQLKSADVVVVVIGSLEPRDESLLNEVGRFEPLVFCTDPVSTLTLRWALDKGVMGVVWNADVDEKLLVTVRAVGSGQLVFPAELRRQSNGPELTNREKQALGLVIMGLTNREIAQTLFISESTVKSHLNTAFRKLGVGSRVEAAELITDPDEGLGTGILAITPAGHRRGRGAS